MRCRCRSPPVESLGFVPSSWSSLGTGPVRDLSISQSRGIIGRGAAGDPGLRPSFTGFSHANHGKTRPAAYPDLHIGAAPSRDPALTFEIPLSSARATPPCPGSRAFEWRPGHPILTEGRSPEQLCGVAACRHDLVAKPCVMDVVHDHAHADPQNADARRLAIAFALIVAFVVAEVVAGILGSSLALLSDAGHMLTDAVALGLALTALRLAERPPAGSFTYGMKRAEILSAQVNGVTLLLFGALIIYEGIRRLIEPPDVEGALVLIVAVVGIWVNLLAARLLAGAERKSLNV